MADFDYTGSGTINWFGCAPVTVEYFFAHQFAVNGIAYDRFSANKGRLEEIVIREVYFRHGSVVYKDTFNAIYGEINLCTQAEAIELATIYYENKLANVNAAIGNCQGVFHKPRRC